LNNGNFGRVLKPKRLIEGKIRIWNGKFHLPFLGWKRINPKEAKEEAKEIITIGPSSQITKKPKIIQWLKVIL